MENILGLSNVRGECSKCGKTEPQDWGFYEHGLWICCSTIEAIEDDMIEEAWRLANGAKEEETHKRE